MAPQLPREDDLSINNNHVVSVPPVLPTESNKIITCEDSKKKRRLLQLAFCFFGIVISFTINGILLEKLTSENVARFGLSELWLTFIFCSVYAIFGKSIESYQNKKNTNVPKQRYYILISIAAFGSTITSIVALRYISFITRVLGKSCKSIPVMIMGTLVGKKRYSFQKYVSVLILCTGVSIFMLSAHANDSSQSATTLSSANLDQSTEKKELVVGNILIGLSLLFDGVTGALEDKYIGEYDISAFELMYQLNRYKALFSLFGAVIVSSPFSDSTFNIIAEHIGKLSLLSVSGAFGQAFIFYTIASFGALTTSMIGTSRKVLSIAASIVLFSHKLSTYQSVGLALAIAALFLHSTAGKKKQKQRNSQEIQKDLEVPLDLEPLLEKNLEGKKFEKIEEAKKTQEKNLPLYFTQDIPPSPLLLETIAA